MQRNLIYRFKNPYFRISIPKDIRVGLGGSTGFEVSLKDVTNSEIEILCIRLKQITHQIFQQVRSGMKSLELEDMKLILKTEVKKSIDHSHHVHLGTNEFDESSKFDSLKTITKREEKFRRVVIDDLSGYEKELDSKLEGILKSLDIEFKPSSLPYKQLRRSFVKLYSLRFDWIKDLINESGRTDDDFRRDADEKLRMELFPELQSPPSVQIQVGDQILNPVIENLAPEPTQPYRVGSSLPTLQSIPISKGIELFLEEKPKDIRTKTYWEIETSLNLMVKGLGDIEMGRINQEMGTTLKSQLRKLPKNSSKLPQYKDKDFHELVKMEVKDTISDTTVNKHLTHLSSFMDWSKRHGYSNLNPFQGLKIKRNISARDAIDPFSEQELKVLFFKHTYLDQTNIENKKYAYYWVPLISLFSGMRLNEICSLYIDNVREISGNHREKRWCFDILEELNRPQKKLKNLSSRRVVPIHETLLDLGLIDFIKLLKSVKYPNREWKEKRLFEELPFGEGSFARNVSRWWNSRYLPKHDLKTPKKNFHSLRHTVSNHLKQKGVEPHFINELLGHSQGNIDLDRYGKGYNPDILFNKCVKRIGYQTSHSRGIDFSPLKVDWKKIIQ